MTPHNRINHAMTLIPLIAALLTATPSPVSDGAIVPQPRKPICANCSAGQLASGETALVLSFDPTVQSEIAGMAVTALAKREQVSLWFGADALVSSTGADTVVLDVSFPYGTQRVILDVEMADGSLVTESIPIINLR
ncbi:MAG: hypothetical protein AAFV53_08295 [Myxococcota bacterium]